MKEYIKQFYNEGLANIFYKRPISYIDKRINNKKVVKLLSWIIKIVYTILALIFAGYTLYKKLPI